MTYQEAYEQALKQVRRDFRWFKDEEGEWYQLDVNEKERKQLAHDIMLEAEE